MQPKSAKLMAILSNIKRNFLKVPKFCEIFCLHLSAIARELLFTCRLLRVSFCLHVSCCACTFVLLSAVNCCACTFVLLSAVNCCACAFVYLSAVARALLVICQLLRVRFCLHFSCCECQQNLLCCI
jgi:hypothetical protein